MTDASILAARAAADPRLGSVVDLAGFEPIARELMAPAAFDYVAGGAGDEESLAQNLAAWRATTLRPRVLVDVSTVDLVDDPARGAGRRCRSASPRWPATAWPTRAPRSATAGAAAAAGVPFTLSTMSNRSIEEVAAAGARRHPLVPALRPARPRLRPRGSCDGPRRPASGRSCSPSTCRSSATASATGGAASPSTSRSGTSPRSRRPRGRSERRRTFAARARAVT